MHSKRDCVEVMIVEKAAFVISGCKNRTQLDVAYRYCCLVAKKLKNVALIAKLASMHGYAAGRIDMKKEIENG